MNNFDPNFISKCCGNKKCDMCQTEQARHKVEEVLFKDDPTAYRQGISGWEPIYGNIIGTVEARHPSTAYVCSKCFGKIMGRTTIPGFVGE